MKPPVRLCFAVLVTCWLFQSGLALGHPAVTPERQEPAGSPLQRSLTVPAVQELVEGQKARSAVGPQYVSPADRVTSQTRFAQLSAGAAVNLDSREFSAIVDHVAGGIPGVLGAARIIGYPSSHTARLRLPDGRRAVLDALGPIDIQTGRGRGVPIDLDLSAVAGGFAPSRPQIGVLIPRNVGVGVRLGDSGFGLTPTDASGKASTGDQGLIVGSSVLYPNTARDSDTVVKPLTLGFELGTVLRSVRSPHSLYFRADLPTGARLMPSPARPGALDVTAAGTNIATVLPPVAIDASGADVPVSVHLTGRQVVLSVGELPGGADYPVFVDPSVVSDKELDLEPGNWVFHTSNPEAFYACPKSGQKISTIRLTNQKNCTSGKGQPYASGQIGYLEYPTQGESQIYAFTSTFKEFNEAPEASIVNRVELRSATGEIEHGTGEGGLAEITEPATKKGEHVGVEICRLEGCGPLSEVGIKEKHDSALFEQEAIRGFSTEYLWFMEFKNATVQIEQSAVPTAHFDTTDSTIEGKPNAMLAGVWYNAKATAGFGVDARDPGIGIQKQGLSSPTRAGWGYPFQNESRNGCEGVQCNECFEPACAGKASGPGVPLAYGLATAEGGELPDGEDTVEAKVEDAAGLSGTATGTVKIDSSPPHTITVNGLPSSRELPDGHTALLKVSASDGSEGVHSSGIASLVLSIDGQEVGSPEGTCSPGPCTANGEWTISGENLGAGEHLLTVTATDKAGNVATEEFHVTVRHAQAVPVGPGRVNPITGELNLTATDVSLTAPTGGFSVIRSYRSRHLAQGTEGPLGPQWIMSVGPEQSLTRVTGGMVLTSPEGGQTIFTATGNGGFSSPAGDSALVLKEGTREGKTIFTLANNGSTTTFELPSGASGGTWTPASSEGPNGTAFTTYKFRLENGVIEPVEEIAPVPAGVACAPELHEGCRALTFTYARESKAGENASEWNEFAGHLSKIQYVAWNASKEKTETTVAEYAYDKKGRLRAEWDPRVTPSPLKVTYGYDAEGHVTAVSPPGQEPSLLEYGTSQADGLPGRLLAVSVPSAQTALGNGESPGNTELPVLSSTAPVVGTKISVSSNGKWSASPLAFTYQWDDCNASGKECIAIPGAVNQAYYPTASDEGHALVAQVTALNATGGSKAATAATSAVAPGTPNTQPAEPPAVGSSSVWTLEYQVPVAGTGAPYEMDAGHVAQWAQTDVPAEATALFPPDTPMGWPAREYKRATVYYSDSRDRLVNTALPSGGIGTTEYNAYNDVVRTLTPDNRAAAVKEGCASEKECKSAEVSKLLDTESTYEEKGSEPGTELLSTLAPQHTVALASGKEGKIDEEALARDHTSYAYNEGAPTEGGPYHLVTKTVEGAQTAAGEFDKRTTAYSYSGNGWQLRKPTSVTIDPGGLNLVRSTEYDSATGHVIATKTPAAVGKDASVAPVLAATFGAKGTGAGQFSGPRGVALDPQGNVWVTDDNHNRLEEFTSSGSFVETIGWGVSDGKAEFEICKSSCRSGLAGAERGEFRDPSALTFSRGDLYVVERTNYRVQVFNEKLEYVTAFGTKGSAAGQLYEPNGLAVDASGNLWVADTKNNRVDVFSAEGAFILAFGYGVVNGKSEYEVCTSTCKVGVAGAGNGQFSKPHGVAILGEAVWVSDFSNGRVERFTTGTPAYVSQIGSKGKGEGQFAGPLGLAFGASGHLYVVDSEDGRVEEFGGPGYKYITQFGSVGSGAGQLLTPDGTAVAAGGQIYVVDTGNNRVEQWAIPITGNEGAHETKTIYYTVGSNSEPACGEHPAYANLPCETAPGAQPGTPGLPETTRTKYTYNIWSEPEVVTESAGSATKTTTLKYDAAGRMTSEGTTATAETALPATTYEYSATSGVLEKQSTTKEGKTATITSQVNRRGQLTAYTDSDENTSAYEYDVDERPVLVNDGKGTQQYVYDESTGLLSEIVDSAHAEMRFKATYDPEGNMVAESYPNGMTAFYVYNAVGKPVHLEYKKETSCAERCNWFTDGVVPSIHGQWLEQSSSLSHQAYAYDAAGRLVEVQSTPAGQQCVRRVYEYDEDTNRTAMTTRGPATECKLATEGGSVEGHSYDTADRLTDSGVTYGPFGDLTSLPAADAGGAALSSAFYADGQVARQEQGGQVLGYNLDPARRTREVVATGQRTADTISHFANPNNAPTWTANTNGEWTRNIAGINGQLAAIESNGEAPILQIADLHGDVVATAYYSEAATELAGKADTSEYGVPTVSAPAKYSWLGSIELPTELPSGVVGMGVRSYVPQIGRFLQPDPVAGGSANPYGYTFGDPVNSSDPTGAYAASASKTIAAALEHEAQAAAARRAAEAAAARQLAEAQARFAAAEAAAAAGPQYAGGEEGPEEWEEWEEGEEEGAQYADFQNAQASSQSSHEESAVFYTPIPEASSGGSEVDQEGRSGASGSSTPTCDGTTHGSGRAKDCTKAIGGFGLGPFCAAEHRCRKVIQRYRHGARGGVNIDQACEGFGAGAALEIFTRMTPGPVSAAATVVCGVAGAVKLVEEFL